MLIAGDNSEKPTNNRVRDNIKHVMANFNQYNQNVFTSLCNTSAQDFMSKIVSSGLLDELKKVQGLVVYYGYHGSINGHYDRAFNEAELEGIRDFISQKISNATNNIAVERISTGQEFSDHDIVGAIQRGNVFFAWCSSDARVRLLLNPSANTSLKSF